MNCHGVADVVFFTENFGAYFIDLLEVNKEQDSDYASAYDTEEGEHHVDSEQAFTFLPDAKVAQETCEELEQMHQDQDDDQVVESEAILAPVAIVDECRLVVELEGLLALDVDDGDERVECDNLRYEVQSLYEAHRVEHIEDALTLVEAALVAEQPLYDSKLGWLALSN